MGIKYLISFKKINHHLQLLAYLKFLELTDMLCSLMPSVKKEEPKKKVLIVRLDAIGDFILWLDAAKEFRNIFPQNEYHITLLGNRLYTSLAEKLPYFDEVWSADRNRLIGDLQYRINLMLRVRKGNFYIAIQPIYSREYLYGDSIIKISGAVERIGSIGDFSNISPKKKRRSDHWYSTLIPAQLAPLMELRRNAEFMRGLGLTNFLCGIPELPVSFPLPAGFVLQDYYILMPGAGARYRQWTAKNFKELAQRVYKATGWTGITCGGPAEKDLGEKIINGLDIPLQDWIGRTSLEELIALISKSSLLVANETSAVHIAAAVSTPCVCILGGGHYGRFIPYDIDKVTDKQLPLAVTNTMPCFGCNWKCIYKRKGTPPTKPYPCIEHIALDDVWQAVQKMLSLSL